MLIPVSANSRNSCPDQGLKVTGENPPQASIPALDAGDKKFNSRSVVPRSASPAETGPIG